MKKAEPRKTFSITLPVTLFKQFMATCGDVPRSVKIRRLIEKAIEQKKEGE